MQSDFNPDAPQALGAKPQNSGLTTFSIWAPYAESVSLILNGDREVSMERQKRGYFSSIQSEVNSGDRYLYRINGQDFPDPASRSQPEGVHSASEVMDLAFDWKAGDWQGHQLGDYIVYELHVGTFTEEGTFAAAEKRLPYLKELGITAVELMPVAQVSGERNWGYDGVYPFAVQSNLGGAKGLQHFVDRCHQLGLGVILDVVYNHLGPDGNYLGQFGPYFTEKYKTPWGAAMNFDGSHSDEVRHYFIENALQWFRDFRIDALRLDALHAICDFSAFTFLEELSQEVERFRKEQGRKIYLIAETDDNNSRLIRPREQGGSALDGQWLDDFHHALHTVLTRESRGYYQDFGSVDQLRKSLEKGYVYDGQHSEFRGRKHGNSSEDLSPQKFVVCSQNHDQVGNRAKGERLSQLVSFEALKLAAATTIFSPYLPMLFMGEEYGEEAPFLYFVSFPDEELARAVREGRRKEFSSFGWKGDVPDPTSLDTFQRSKLSWDFESDSKRKKLLDWYKRLIWLRRECDEIRQVERPNYSVWKSPEADLLAWTSQDENAISVGILHFESGERKLSFPNLKDHFMPVLSSEEEVFGGRGWSKERREFSMHEGQIWALGFEFQLWRKELGKNS